MLTHRGFAHWENGQIPLENGEAPAGRINESSLLPKMQNFISFHEKNWLSLKEIPPLLPRHLTHIEEEHGSQIPRPAAGITSNLLPVSERGKVRSQGLGCSRNG